MNWKAYKLIYTAKSPVHIGWHTLGYIALTRYYIPGKNMWAAFTENLTRAGKVSGDIAGMYKETGESVKKNLITSYFYPSIEGKPLLPMFTGQGLKMGDYEVAEFEGLFIKSFGQTAVLPQSNTAEDESLHESEFISPCAADGKQVSFAGYVFVNKAGLGRGWEDVKDIVREISVGGERKYGWGRLVLESCNEETATFFNLGVDLSDAAAPKVTIPANSHIPAHIAADCGLRLKGDMEPLVGREWGTAGSGREISRNIKVCWVPGSVLMEEAKLKISDYGILSL